MRFWTLLRRLLKAAVWLVLVVAAIPIVGLAYGYATTDRLPDEPLPGLSPPPPARAAELRGEIPGYQRPEESTFLTYPEWAIVYAAREYAGFVAQERPSAFPYWAYVGRFWRDYATMIRASADDPFNVQNHAMLIVIGTSHTVEHALQWAYENSVGRLTELVSGADTAADRRLADIARDYALFLDQVPWYEYPYAGQRDALWALEAPPEDDKLRVWERKAAFGLAYTVKQAYAELIRSGLSATADPAFLDIHVWAQGPVAAAIGGEDETRMVRDLGEDGAVFVTRRYQVFTEMIPRLIERGVRFVEIGGNDEILVTLLSTAPPAPPPGSRVLFAYALPAKPEVTRTGLLVAVPRLHEALPALAAAGAALEHVYDY